MTAFLYLTDRISRLDAVVHGLAFGSGLRLCVARADLVVAHGNGSSKLYCCYWQNITSVPLIVTQFILVQPATHKGNSLKTLFTKYMTRDMTTTQVHITHEAWHDI